MRKEDFVEDVLALLRNIKDYSMGTVDDLEKSAGNLEAVAERAREAAEKVRGYNGAYEDAS